MDHMSKNLLLALCITLSGCVLYAPTYNSQETVIHYAASAVDNHSTVTTTTNAVTQRGQTNKPHSSAQRLLADCGPFDLPPAGKVPKQPSEEDLELAINDAEVDKMISAYANSLRTYIASERSKIEQAHRSWLDSCRQK
ncbi:hypothetical protein AVT69_gp177 [Pseudomonas phage PhiPA3]|uniref:Uncharacterized protein 179 n=1 Tax=Pseudomonas phage PhiPA3 TaxID=998086 RepID=F8SJL7_BPPA3|nr:hypothetical protein AVT69_gp177 [Pseudomonas phage PhiPA3]AEH03602.1 hypothetical protein [Pseudomonas phage PhiPA3]